MTEQSAWALPSLEGHLSLQDGEVVVVCAPVSSAEWLPLAWLDATERRRLAAYRFAADRMRHHAAHALKRLAIGSSLRQSPRHLEFVVEENGKPRLENRALHFNLSHSGQWVAVALCRNGEVGVDVESRRHTSPALPWPKIGHPDDCALTDAESFLTAWTIKEAAAKCCGDGLALDFARLRMRQVENATYCCSDDRRQWQAWHGMLDPDTHLAVAVAQAWSRLRRLRVTAPFVIE
jgi:4'-phosphopantetheinyl transferase